MYDKLRHAWYNPKDVLYFIQGCLHYAFRYITGKTINKKEFLRKKKGASECFKNGPCLECGCDTELMLLSSKPCPKRKYYPYEKSCY